MTPTRGGFWRERERGARGAVAWRERERDARGAQPPIAAADNDAEPASRHEKGALPWESPRYVLDTRSSR